jgi:beta-glucanase (GH16 family)
MSYADPPVGGRWKPVPELSDEFEGDKLDAARWHDHNPRLKGRRPGFFSPRNVDVSDGKLRLTARAEDLKDLPKGFHTFTTAAVQSKTRVRYGYFEIKCKPMDSEASSAFWFSDPSNKAWTEIDVFEIGGASPGREHAYYMNAHVHAPASEGAGEEHLEQPGQWDAPYRLAAEYHVYALEWDEKEIKWYVDGKIVRTLKNTHWHQPLYMNFDSETMPEWFGLPRKENLPSTFSIEYVRSWQRIEDSEPGDPCSTK